MDSEWKPKVGDRVRIRISPNNPKSTLWRHRELDAVASSPEARTAIAAFDAYACELMETNEPELSPAQRARLLELNAVSSKYTTVRVPDGTEGVVIALEEQQVLVCPEISQMYGLGEERTTYYAAVRVGVDVFRCRYGSDFPAELRAEFVEHFDIEPVEKK